MSSEEGFPVAAKSTLDKACLDLARSMDLGFADLDDEVQVQAAIDSDDPYLLWRFISIDEDPRDPLYRIGIVLGLKTNDDRSGYTMLDLAGKVKAQFGVGDELAIYDWSGDQVPTQKEGSMFFTISGVDAQDASASMGFRLLAVAARAVRFT